jgi:hypothetical protein|tara:strand:+ start:1862 stop:2047 length:186 start_codon:yes stop_codon:yes gene_type:complete
MAEEYAINFRAPALPFPPDEYDKMYVSQFNALLRIYFNQVDNTLRDTSIVNKSEAQGWFLG